MARSSATWSRWNLWYHSSPRAAASSARRCTSAMCASCSATRASRRAWIAGSTAAVMVASQPFVKPTQTVLLGLDLGTVERRADLILLDDLPRPGDVLVQLHPLELIPLVRSGHHPSLKPAG